MMSQWHAQIVISLAFHPHGEHVSPILEIFSCTLERFLSESYLLKK